MMKMNVLNFSIIAVATAMALPVLAEDMAVTTAATSTPAAGLDTAAIKEKLMDAREKVVEFKQLDAAGRQAALQAFLAKQKADRANQVSAFKAMLNKHNAASAE